MAGGELARAIDLPSLSRSEQVKNIDLLFEASPALHAIAVPIIQGTACSTYDQLVNNIQTALYEMASESSDDQDDFLKQVLGSHPRLGSQSTSSVMSIREQSGLHSHGPAVLESLHMLNQAYEDAFPGLIFVTFVNGRDYTVIMDEMRARIARYDFPQERLDSIKAMCDIARDRVRKLQAV